MTTTQTTARFTLDEDKARDWLPELHPDRYKERPDHDRPEIDDDYDPRTDYECGSTAFHLVASARDAGIITGPGSIDYEHDNDGQGDIGYTWLLRLRSAGDNWSELKLSSLYEDLRHCGEPDVKGAVAALAVLREAVWAANTLLDDLDRYIASRANVAA